MWRKTEELNKNVNQYRKTSGENQKLATVVGDRITPLLESTSQLKTRDEREIQPTIKVQVSQKEVHGTEFFPFSIKC